MEVQLTQFKGLTNYRLLLMSIKLPAHPSRDVVFLSVWSMIDLRKGIISTVLDLFKSDK